MARYDRLLTDARGRSVPCFRKRPLRQKAADCQPTTAKCWKGFYRSYAAALAGNLPDEFPSMCWRRLRDWEE